MDFHGINTVGKNWLERVSTKPVWDAAYEGRIIYAQDTQTLSFGALGAWIDVASPTVGGISNPDVPISAILLFESDVQLTGYTLLVDQDGDLIYISSGGAGGYRAGTTWTQPTHAHAAQPHTLTIAQMPAHSHPPQSGFGNFMSSTGSSHGESGDSYGVFSNTGNTGGGQQHTHPNSAVNGTVASWRPRGRNWTRQQRN
jgi:hypothetical protein